MEPSAGLVAQHVGEDREVPRDRRRLSADSGQPRSPRTVATKPSDASAPAVCSASSGWSTTGSPNIPAYSSAWRRSVPDRTGAPSSENPTTPASASSPSGRQRLARPTGAHRSVRPARATGEPDATAAARTRSTTPGSSAAGVVFGIAQTTVNPPCAGRGLPARDRLGILVARLAQVRVQVDEAGRDDDAAIVDAGRLVALEPGDRREDAVLDDDLARSFAAARRIDEPGPADLQIGDRCRRRNRPAADDRRDPLEPRSATDASRAPASR